MLFMQRPNTRRQVIQIGGGLAVILTAGCLGGELADDQDDGDADDADDGDDGDDQPAESPVDDGDDTDDEQADDSSDDDYESQIDDDGDDENDEDDEDEIELPPEPIPESELLNDFEDLPRWDVINGDWQADPELYFVGSQSAHVSIDDENIRGAIAYRFRPPVELHRRGFQLAVQSDRTIRPWIQLVDIYGNQISFRTLVRGNLDFQLVDFGIDSVPNEIDLGAVETLRIVTSIPEAETREINFDSLRVAGRPSPGIVMIHFDDVVETQYTHAYPILEEYDMQATAMVNVGYIGRIVGGRKRTTPQQLEELYEAGWDVGNHGMYHLNLLDADNETRVREIQEAHDWLADYGFDRGANYFSYPYSRYNQRVIDIVAEDHDLAFAGGYPALARVANPYLVHRAHGDPSAEDAIATLDLTAAWGGITTLFYHDVSGDDELEFSAAVEHLAKLRDEGLLRVVTVSEIEDELLDDSIDAYRMDDVESE